MGERGNMTPPTHNAYTHTRLTEASPLCPLRIVKSDKYYVLRETKKPRLPFLYFTTELTLSSLLPSLLFAKIWPFKAIVRKGS